MGTEVVLTGTGVPLASDRAGPGTLIRTDGLNLQIDAGRGTTMRLVGAGVLPQDVDVVFLTHHHSDHLLGFDDLLITRYMHFVPALALVAPRGPSVLFAQRFMDRWGDDIAVRQEHTGRTDRPEVEITGFDSSSEPRAVWEREGVRVTSIEVWHRPVRPAVAYRIDTPDARVVVSGDTIVCEEVERISRGADVLVHEIARARWLRERIAGTPWEVLLDYHADSIELGAMAERAGVPTLVLTHLVPPPRNADDLTGFVEDVREGGYTGDVVIGPDLTSVKLP